MDSNNNNSSVYDETFSDIADLETVEWALSNINQPLDIKRTIFSFTIGDDKYLYDRLAENIKHLKSNLFINTILSSAKSQDYDPVTLQATPPGDSFIFFRYLKVGYFLYAQNHLGSLEASPKRIYELYFKNKNIYATNRGKGLVISKDKCVLCYTMPENQLLCWDQTFSDAEGDELNKMYDTTFSKSDRNPFKDINFPRFEQYIPRDQLYSLKAARLLFAADTNNRSNEQRLIIQNLQTAIGYIEKIENREGKVFLSRFVDLIAKNHNFFEAEYKRK